MTAEHLSPAPRKSRSRQSQLGPLLFFPVTPQLQPEPQHDPFRFWLATSPSNNKWGLGIFDRQCGDAWSIIFIFKVRRAAPTVFEFPYLYIYIYIRLSSRLDSHSPLSVSLPVQAFTAALSLFLLRVFSVFLSPLLFQLHFSSYPFPLDVEARSPTAARSCISLFFPSCPRYGIDRQKASRPRL